MYKQLTLYKSNNFNESFLKAERYLKYNKKNAVMYFLSVWFDNCIIFIFGGNSITTRLKDFESNLFLTGPDLPLLLNRVMVIVSTVLYFRRYYLWLTCVQVFTIQFM